MFKAIGVGITVAAVILFAGYMCGAPIIERSPDNWGPYFVAIIAGGWALVVSLICWGK